MLREFVQWYWGTTRWVGVLYALIIILLFAILAWVLTSGSFDGTCVIVEVIATPSMPGVKAK